MFSKDSSKDSDRVQKLGRSILSGSTPYSQHRFKEVTEKTVSVKIEAARKKILTTISEKARDL